MTEERAPGADAAPGVEPSAPPELTGVDPSAPPIADRSAAADADPWPLPPPPPAPRPFAAPPPPPPGAPAQPVAPPVLLAQPPVGGSRWMGPLPSLPPLLGRGTLVLATLVGTVIALFAVPSLAAIVRHGSVASVGVDGRLWVAVIVAVLVVIALAAGRRWLRAAAAATGAAGIRDLLAARTVEAPDTAPSASWLPRPGPTVIPAARRTVMLAATSAVLGALVFLGASARVRSALVEGAGQLDPAVGVPLAWAALAGIAGIVLAASLLPAVLRGIERRRFAAAGDRDGRRTPVPGNRPAWAGPLVLVAILVLIAVPDTATSFGGSVPGTATTSADCELDDPWTCHATSVPADLADPTGPRLTAAWALRPAARPDGASGRKILVLVDGGPGASGLEDASWMADALGPRVLDAYDIVAFDARGVGGTDEHECAVAGRRYSTATLSYHAVRSFVDDCIREAGVPVAGLRRFGSAQIAADIDAIRAELGVDRISLYGQSYGSVIAQAYAAAYRDHVDRLVLDAPVDRQVPTAALWVTAANGFQAAVDETLEACSADDLCAEAIPDPRHRIERVYQQLGSTRTMSDVVVQPDGSKHRQSMSSRDWESMLYQSMYAGSDRMRLLRALAAIDHGDRRAMLRLMDVIGGASRPGDFAYYATWCADAGLRATDDEEAAFDAFLAVAKDRGLEREGLLDIAWTLAPCVLWPVDTAGSAPPEFAGLDTLVLTSTADPITPPSEARAIVARHPEARLVETRGGAHGSLGDTCPMERVTAFLVDGRLPVASPSTCPGQTISPFVPLAKSPAATADDAATGVYDELWASPEVLWWDGTRRLDVGCTDGGHLTLSAMDGQDRSTVDLVGCSWAANATFDGDGWLNLRSGDASFTLRSSRGTLEVQFLAGRWRVTGTWDGKPVDVDD